MASKDPVEALVGSNTLFLALSFLGGVKEAHLRHIAESIGVNASQLKRQLDKMVEVGVLETRTESNKRLFALSERTSKARAISGLFRPEIPGSKRD
jgi:DNA-binding MarR family transcriptional regulator